MNKSITFKGMDHSQAVENYVNEHLEKIIKFLSNEKSPVFIDMVFEPSKTREHHKIELRVKSPNYHAISTYEHEGTPFYKAIDEVIDVMYRELHEQKRRHVDERREGVSREDKLKHQR